MLHIQDIPVGPLAVNCYLVWDEKTKESLVVDPGDEPELVISTIQQLAIRPKGILLTHGHVDHLRGVPDVSRQFGLPVWIHPEDRWLYDDPQNAILPWLPAAAGLPPVSEAPAMLQGHPFEILHTPGHTPGGVCYYFSEDGELFSGDTLFRGTYGRTDFPRGNEDALFSSIRTKLFRLPDTVRVWPGHNESTTIGTERLHPSF